MHTGFCLSRRSFLSSANSLHPQLILRHSQPRRLFLTPVSYQPVALLTRSYPPHSRLVSTSPFSPAREPRKASSLWLITFTILAAAGGVWIQDKYFYPGKGSHVSTSLPASPHSPFPDSPQPPSMMTTQVSAPGTLGNLTADQEAKLREFWVLVAKVCGIKSEGLEAEEQAPQKAPQNPPPQKMKRRYTWFGRAYDEPDDSASTTSANGAATSVASLSIADGDDKYGQSKEFKQTLEEMTPEEIRITLWNMVKHDNPDGLLLRFLRARKWDVKKALVMLISTIRWRLLQLKVDDDIMKNGEALARKQIDSTDPGQKKAGEEFLAQLRMGKTFLHGVDKAGRPICVVRVRLHRASDQSADVLERLTVFTIETGRLMLIPPVETCTIIFDMTNFTLANMDYTPVKFIIKCFEANYPECLGTILIHKAPWIFSGIWNIIKGWLDPVVAAKVHFTKNVDELENFIHRSQITKELEGDEDWEYKYPEVRAGENKLMDDTAKRDELIGERQELAREIEKATMEWIVACKKEQKSAIPDITQKRNQLIEKLRKQYWDLDPYVRARSLYDRNNVVQPGGKIDFYPAPQKQANGTNGTKEEAKAEANGDANGSK